MTQTWLQLLAFSIVSLSLAGATVVLPDPLEALAYYNAAYLLSDAVSGSAVYVETANKAHIRRHIMFCIVY